LNNLHILINSSYSGDGRFQLTENVFQYIDEYIQYGLLGRYKYDDHFIYNDTNRETNFGSIKFVLLFEHYLSDSSKYNLNIVRNA
jgi:hypothetical protein